MVVVRIVRHHDRLENSIKRCHLANDIENLCSLCIECTTLLEKAVSECSYSLWSMKSDADQQILILVEQLMRQISQSFETCFRGLNELCRTICGRKKRHEVVDRMLGFFSKALDHLQTLCNIQANQEDGGHRQQQESGRNNGNGISLTVTNHRCGK